jgi:mono/diheme cytochrome c family protein
MVRYPCLFVSILACSFCIGTSAVAGDVSGGLAIAQSECAECHSIGKEGASPLSAAPPFRKFGQKWPVEHLEEALAEGMSVSHGPMPEFIFEPEEIPDLVAYLLSIQNQPEKTK